MSSLGLQFSCPSFDISFMVTGMCAVSDFVLGTHHQVFDRFHPSCSVQFSPYFGPEGVNGNDDCSTLDSSVVNVNHLINQNHRPPTNQ